MQYALLNIIPTISMSDYLNFTKQSDVPGFSVGKRPTVKECQLIIMPNSKKHKLEKILVCNVGCVPVHLARSANDHTRNTSFSEGKSCLKWSCLHAHSTTCNLIPMIHPKEGRGTPVSSKGFILSMCNNSEFREV